MKKWYFKIRKEKSNAVKRIAVMTMKNGLGYIENKPNGI